MPFVIAARKFLETLQVGSADRCIMEFLMHNAVGRRNAVTWSRIDAHIRRFGHSIRKQTFQQGLLKRTRENDVFIGSNDHGEGRGYFLIQDKEDADVVRNWYLKRIAVEQSHVDHLDRLISSSGIS